MQTAASSASVKFRLAAINEFDKRQVESAAEKQRGKT